jgi:iron-sulfur cluster assembly protein
MSGCGGCGTAPELEAQEKKVVDENAPTVSLTAGAASKVKHFMKEEKKEGFGLRVAVMPGGCAGYQYGMEFEEKATDDDEVLEQHGVTLFVNKKTAGMLKGTVVDFVDSINGSGFKIDNPNAQQGCACGNSFN